ncbi:NAD-dependent epimerase/dehydratase family protein [Caballeronia sp. SL2Y3]|uniref:NAD-dependent epimerase/dehydratase family protein n=1 Tax=Caballeronia sp. SL2Y3 TaxID=2878151 RepID=UPI001FD5B406|nr:NAD-dependent epimerase/dehydratase family protein [Caballeronia sp. SL2Y3]
MNALITGGFGFIGSHLANYLVSEGWHVKIVDIEGAVPCIPLPPENVTTIYGKYFDPVVMQNSLVDVDVCFHLASSVGPANSNDKVTFDIETNLIGTIQLLEAMRQSGVGRIVYLSSGGTVYGGPHSVPITEDMHGAPSCSYGIVKKTVEHYLSLYQKLHDLEYNVIRLANPYGVGQRLHANQGVIANFIGKILSNAPLEIWGDGSVVRDYVYIADVIRAIGIAATSEARNDVFNIGSGVGLSLAQIVDLLKNECGLDFQVNYTPSRKVDQPINVLDISKAKQRLGWSPKVSITEGIGRTLEWARKQTQVLQSR